VGEKEKKWRLRREEHRQGLICSVRTRRIDPKANRKTTRGGTAGGPSQSCGRNTLHAEETFREIWGIQNDLTSKRKAGEVWGKKEKVTDFRNLYEFQTSSQSEDAYGGRKKKEHLT